MIVQYYVCYQNSYLTRYASYSLCKFHGHGSTSILLSHTEKKESLSWRVILKIGSPLQGRAIFSSYSCWGKKAPPLKRELLSKTALPCRVAPKQSSFKSLITDNPNVSFFLGAFILYFGDFFLFVWTEICDAEKNFITFN